MKAKLIRKRVSRDIVIMDRWECPKCNLRFWEYLKKRDSTIICKKCKIKLELKTIS